jgi:hypothetical protein
MKLSKIATGAAAMALAITTSVTAYAGDAPRGDIASKIMANPKYVNAAKHYALRRGYQAETPVSANSNFLPILAGLVVLGSGTAVALSNGSSGAPASP